MQVQTGEQYPGDFMAGNTFVNELANTVTIVGPNPALPGDEVLVRTGDGEPFPMPVVAARLAMAAEYRRRGLYTWTVTAGWLRTLSPMTPSWLLPRIHLSETENSVRCVWINLLEAVYPDGALVEEAVALLKTIPQGTETYANRLQRWLLAHLAGLASAKRILTLAHAELGLLRPLLSDAKLPALTQTKELIEAFLSKDAVNHDLLQTFKNTWTEVYLAGPEVFSETEILFAAAALVQACEQMVAGNQEKARQYALWFFDKACSACRERNSTAVSHDFLVTELGEIVNDEVRKAAGIND